MYHLDTFRKALMVISQPGEQIRSASGNYFLIALAIKNYRGDINVRRFSKKKAFCWTECFPLSVVSKIQMART